MFLGLLISPLFVSGISFTSDINIRQLASILPVTIAKLSKACTVFALSEAGTLGSNPT
jgi:hypothetical protein